MLVLHFKNSISFGARDFFCSASGYDKVGEGCGLGLIDRRQGELNEAL